MVTLKYKVMLTVLLAIGNGLYSENSDHNVLQKLLTEESERWSVLSYSQLYPYGKSEPVQYTGTVFLKIGSFVLKDCQLKLEVVVQDKYVGAEEQKRAFGGTPIHKETRPLSVSYQYSYRMNLNDIDSARIDTPFGRPAQLLENTRLSCSEEKSCNLAWLRVITKKPSIGETRVVDGFEDIHEMTHQMIIPMTSKDVAAQLGKALQTSAIACHKV